MTSVSLILLLSCIILFILTRETYVCVIYDNGLRLEFHLVIFALILTEGKKEKKPLRNKFSFYLNLTKRLSRLSEKSYIRIRRLSPSNKQGFPSLASITVPCLYYSLLSAFIAYFFDKPKKLIIEDNAFILYPDTKDGIIVDIIISTELYNFIFALIKIFFDFRKTKKKGKIKNVGK